MDLRTDHPKSLSAWVNIMETRFDCLDVASKLLVDAVVGLRNDLVGILDETATKTRHPSTHAPAAFSPTMHTLAV